MAVASNVGLSAAKPQFVAAGLVGVATMIGLPQLSSPHPNPLPEGEGADRCMAVASIVDLRAARIQFVAAGFVGVAAMSGLPELSTPHPNPLPEGEGAGLCMVAASDVDLSASGIQFAVAGVVGVATMGGIPQLSSPHPSPLPEGEGAGLCMVAASDVGLSAAKWRWTPRPAPINPFARQMKLEVEKKDAHAERTQRPKLTPINPLSLRERAGVRATRRTRSLANSSLSNPCIVGNRS